MQWRDDILSSEQQVGARLLQERRRWNRAMLSGGGGRKPGPCKHYRERGGTASNWKQRHLHRYHTLKDGKSVLWGDRETYVENNSPLSTDTALGKYKYELKPKKNMKCDFRVGREWSGKCSDSTIRTKEKCTEGKERKWKEGKCSDKTKKSKQDCNGKSTDGKKRKWTEGKCSDSTIKTKEKCKEKRKGTWTDYNKDKLANYEKIVNLLQKETLTDADQKKLNEHKENMKSGKLKFISKDPSKSDYAVGKCCYVNEYKGTVKPKKKKDMEKKEKKKKSGTSNNTKTSQKDTAHWQSVSV